MHAFWLTNTDIMRVRWVIGNGRLNTSPKLDAYTSIPSTPTSIATLGGGRDRIGEELARHRAGAEYDVDRMAAQRCRDVIGVV
jgi:hypothetical protein